MSKETHDFVTYKVPGIPNGTLLVQTETGALYAAHTDELGIVHEVTIPLTPAAMGAHVRTAKRKAEA